MCVFVCFVLPKVEGEKNTQYIYPRANTPKSKLAYLYMLRYWLLLQQKIKTVRSQRRAIREATQLSKPGDPSSHWGCCCNPLRLRGGSMRPYRNPRAALGREASAWAPLFCRHKRRPCKPGCSLTSARTRRTGSSAKQSSPEITALSVPDIHTWPAKQPSAATPAGRTRPVRLLVVFAVRFLPRPRRPRRV